MEVAMFSTGFTSGQNPGRPIIQFDGKSLDLFWDCAKSAVVFRDDFCLRVLCDL